MICLVPAQAEIKIVTRHLSRPKLDYKVTTQGCYNLHPIVNNSKAHKDGPFVEKGRRQPPKSLVFYDPLKWEKAILNPS